MRKIVRQQNYLRELIESQENHYLAVQSLKCLVRSVLEPLLDEPESGVVLYRIENTSGLQGLLKRLEFSEIDSHDYSDKSGNLLEKVWANTEFICVMTHRYVATIIWDTNTGDKNTVRYYSLYNSKFQNEPLDIIKRNSKIDITPYQEKFTPDRRDNKLLNASFRKLLANMEDAASDAVLGYAEKSAERLTDSDYTEQKSRIAAHEIKNQLSICDLYTGIIRKQLENKSYDEISKSLESIDKAVMMANNCLLSLKLKEHGELKPVDLNKTVKNAVNLARVYAEGKNISIDTELEDDAKILADSDKLTAIIINLVKNAVEAFYNDLSDDAVSKNGKYIKIKTDLDEDFAQIMVSNNAEGIKDPERIFDEGFSTKMTGSGLGLWICKKSAEEMMGELSLSRSSEDYTEFTIKLGLAK